ncbi:MAG: P-loop NTPase [Nitrososphaerales archaeon]|nr:P-loop NTPase [Nitrososphaerales archaeon]
MSIDARLSIIDKRLNSVRRVIAVVSGKGGVGKTLVSSVLALTMAKEGLSVGLLDFDFTGSSCHIVYGLDEIRIVEDKGLIPLETSGVKFMSIEPFTKGSPLELRGFDVSNIVLEIMANTHWGGLDFLVIDMPPSLKEELLDLRRFVGKAEYLVVYTPSKLVINMAFRLITLLNGSGASVLGVVENMVRGGLIFGEKVERLNVKLLARIPFDADVEKAIGKPKRLLETKFASAIFRLYETIKQTNT